MVNGLSDKQPIDKRLVNIILVNDARPHYGPNLANSSISLNLVHPKPSC